MSLEPEAGHEAGFRDCLNSESYTLQPFVRDTNECYPRVAVGQHLPAADKCGARPENRTRISLSIKILRITILSLRTCTNFCITC